MASKVKHAFREFQERHFTCKFIVFSFVARFSEKRFARGVRDFAPAPREPKTAQNHIFLLYFLVLHKSSKMASTPALKRPSCELFGALGPQKMHVTCIFTMIFCLQEENTCIFTGFGGHERATRDPKRNTKQHFTCIFTGVLHLGCKSEGMKE